MEQELYTTLGDIAKAGAHYYQEHKTKSGFNEILLSLKKQGKLTTSPNLFRPSSRILSPEELRVHAYSLPVNVNQVLFHDPSVINEKNFFTDHKDIHTTVLVSNLSDQLHTHDFFEINYVYQGSYTQVFETERRVFHKGNLIIIAPDSPHMVIVNDDSIIVSTLIRKSTFEKEFWHLLENRDILSSFFRYALYDNSIHNYLFLMIDVPNNYERLLQSMLNETNSHDAYSNNMAISYSNLFFGTLLREFGHNIHPYTSGHSLSLNTDFPLMMNYVEHNYATVSLPVLSELFHYREEYISKMFKKYLDRNFSAILQDIRLAHACSLLKNTDYTIEKITEFIGYDSSDYLTRIFKKKYGVTPSAYRKMIHKDRSSVFL